MKCFALLGRISFCGGSNRGLFQRFTVTIAMNLSKFVARLWAMAAVVGPCVFWPAAAAAAESPKGGKDGAGVWVICYALVFLFVVLGLMFLLRPSGRRDRPKMEQ